MSTNTLIRISDGMPRRVNTGGILPTPPEGYAWVDGAPPGPNMLWAGTEWVPAPVDLDALKVAKRAEIDEARTAAILAPITWDGSTFLADRDSMLTIMGALGMVTASIYTTQTWTLADGMTRDMEGADVVALMGAIGTRTAAAHATSRDLMADIDAATTASEVAAVAWPT